MVVRIGGSGVEEELGDEDISERPCCCEEYVTRPVKRAKGKTPVCSAKVLRGAGYYKCQRPCTSSLNFDDIVEYYCKEHRDRFKNHKACAHCHKFIKSGLAAVCIANPAHISHVSCTIRESKPGNPLCSHCCQPTKNKWFSEVVTVNIAIDEELSYKEALKQKNAEILEKIIMKRALDLAEETLPGFYEPSHLVELLLHGLSSVIRTSRCFGAPITSATFWELIPIYTEELWNSLEIDQEYHFLLEEVDGYGDTPISSSARREQWEYLKKLLKHFDYQSVDVEMQTGRDRRTVRQLCSQAPDDVKEALEHAAKIRSYSRSFVRKRILHEDLSHGTERFPIRVTNDVDDEYPAAFTYSTRVVDRTGILKLRKSDEMLICNCRAGCEMDCECNSGIYDEEGRAKLDRLEAPFLECSSDCLCNMACGNRVAQKGATHPVEIFRTIDGRGWGVRALCKIRKGTFIGEYTGELLTDADANRRIDSYLFETSVGDQNYTVDARLLGNFTRFINHSCEPNAKVCMVVWDWQIEQLSHICIFATTDIFKGEEITISYGEHWWRAKITEFPCRCKQVSCEFTENKRQALLRKQAETASTSSSSYDSEAASE